MMRTWMRFLLTGALLVTGVLVAGAKSITLTPAGGSPVKVKVAGKEQTYYTLSSSAPLRVTVDGPGTLTVLSRLMLPAATTGSADYTIVVREKGTAMGSQKTGTAPSDAIVIPAGTAAGKLRKFNVRVPPGSHQIEVVIEGSGSPAAVKLQLQKGKQKLSRSNLQARSYSRVATAVVKEKLLTYYVAAKDRGVQIRVIGPTRLKVTTRLNYDASMKGGQKYSVSVWEGDRRVQLKSLSTTKALAASYQDWKDVIPGKAVSFMMPVPSGEHYYYYKLEGGGARSISFRFSIPKKDLKNEG